MRPLPPRRIPVVVYLFCPDSVSQGVGLLRESAEPARFGTARKLCPRISQRLVRRTGDALAQLEGRDPAAARQFRHLLAATSAGSADERDGVRPLADDLRRRKYLSLWWD